MKIQRWQTKTSPFTEEKFRSAKTKVSSGTSEAKIINWSISRQLKTFKPFHRLDLVEAFIIS